MGNLLSPGVAVTETDLTNIIPNTATSNGASVGQFVWGPVNEIKTIDSESALVKMFGKPASTGYEDWFAVANYLAYARNLKVVRVVGAGALNASCTASAGGAGQLIENDTAYEALSFTSSLDLFVAQCPGVLGNALEVAWCDTTGYNAVDSNGDYTFTYRDLFSYAPDANEFHIVVIDSTGAISGTAGTVLEIFDAVSTVAGSVRFDGSSNYIKTRLENSSVYIYVANITLLTGTNNGVVLAGGANGSAATDGDYEGGWALFQNKEELDISTLIVGGASTTVGKWVIDNIAEVRKDCVAFVSGTKANIVGITDTSIIKTNLKATRTTFGNTNYGFMDGNYKYQYNRYTDSYVWVPLNGDTAGLYARTANDRDAWWSFAGLNRGRIKNVVKLAFSPSLTDRDELYQSGINPVVIFNGEGAVLFGDKTLQTKPSAFDRINVRMLFIAIEKSIELQSKYMLFEQNDDYTRRQFVNMVEPFLRDVQGRRGIIDYRVVCDATNNTGEVIDRNEFVADIYVKPTRSINFIKLNFVAVRSGISFNEVVVQ